MKFNKKIGNQIDESDFITAPECSPFFGELLGNFMLYQQYIGMNNKQNLKNNNQNLNKKMFDKNNYEKWTIVEVGGGTGFNVINMLHSIMKVDINAFKHLTLVLIDKSP